MTSKIRASDKSELRKRIEAEIARGGRGMSELERLIPTFLRGFYRECDDGKHDFEGVFFVDRFDKVKNSSIDIDVCTKCFMVRMNPMCGYRKNESLAKIKAHQEKISANLNTDGRKEPPVEKEQDSG